ncbi:hypothetical protein C2G38_2230914 [Gigaspora rosea]|uniref:Uncharacterized protein n=1 Tax=Gigaspora rosea TaxID=44941 RepID=A0A397TVH6_9GLOM|nr:hypothetical protein C2G38_2230914 [Gigaspora rosea]
MCLHSAFLAYLYIYTDWISIYNPTLEKPLKETWPKVYKVLNSQFESVRISRKGTYFNDFCYVVQCDGYEEDIFFKHETTQNVLSARRLMNLVVGFPVMSLENVHQIITKVLSNNNADIPYVLIYFVDSKSNSGSGCSIARLIATTFDHDDKTG